MYSATMCTNLQLFTGASDVIVSTLLCCSIWLSKSYITLLLKTRIRRNFGLKKLSCFLTIQKLVNMYNSLLENIVINCFGKRYQLHCRILKHTKINVYTFSLCIHVLVYLDTLCSISCFVIPWCYIYIYNLESIESENWNITRKF